MERHEIRTLPIYATVDFNNVVPYRILSNDVLLKSGWEQLLFVKFRGGSEQAIAKLELLEGGMPGA